MLEFLKAAFLVLHFSCYTLMTFLMMLSVILLSMAIIILCILIVIRHLIYGSNLAGVDLSFKLDWGSLSLLLNLPARKLKL